MILLSLLLLISISCETYYEDLPPFYVGATFSGLFPEEPVKVGKSFGISVGGFTDYYLENIIIKIILPPEVVVKSYPPDIVKKLSQDDITVMKNLEWKGNIKPKSGKDSIFHLWLISTTEWTKWSRPIEIHISLDARATGKYPPWPIGFYTKTITWSHEGYNDPGWIGPDNKVYK